MLTSLSKILTSYHIQLHEVKNFSENLQASRIAVFQIFKDSCFMKHLGTAVSLLSIYYVSLIYSVAM